MKAEADSQAAFSNRFGRKSNTATGNNNNMSETTVRAESTVSVGHAAQLSSTTNITVVRADGQSFGFMLAEMNNGADLHVFISSVTANGAADEAGLQPGDKLTAIEGNCTAAATLQNATATIAACAAQVTLAVTRSSSRSFSPSLPLAAPTAPAAAAGAAAATAATAATAAKAARQGPNQTGAAPGRILERVVAGHRYAATHKDELSFDVGDVIHVVDKRETGWWAGHLNGKSGWFPATYVVTGSVVVVVQGDGNAEGAEEKIGSAPPSSSDITSGDAGNKELDGGDANDANANQGNANSTHVDDDLPSPGDSDLTEEERANAKATKQADALKAAAIEIGRLTATLDAAKAREKRLEDGKAALEASLKSLREQHVNSARAQQTALSKQMEQVASSSTESEEQLADTTTQLEQEQAKNEKLEEQLAESLFELSDARSSRTELNDRIDKLETACTVAEAAAATHEKAAAAAAAQLEEEHARHARSLDSTTSAADDMLAQQRAADDKIVSITGKHTLEVAELNAKIETLEASERQSSLALQEEREQRTLAESQLADIKRQASGLQRKADSTNDVLSGLHEKIAQLTLELEQSSRAKLDAEAAAARISAINKSREEEIETERTRRRGSEERAVGLEATVLSSRTELTRANESASAARKEMEAFRTKLKGLEGIKSENFHLHSILKLKDGKEVLATSIETDKLLREARHDRDEARAECDRLRSGKGDDVASKFLIRITELEQENEGLTQMVDKMVQQLTTKLTNAE